MNLAENKQLRNHIKDYGDGGLGQRVRGVHMRLHAGSHIDAPSHMIEGGKDMHELPLEAFIGSAMVADVRHRGPKQAITADDLGQTAGATLPWAVIVSV